MVYSAETPRAIFPARRPLYYCITDRGQLTRETLVSNIRRVIEWGVDFLQIREKDLVDRELYRVTARAVAIARKTDCKIIVNGRADIALATGAHGVHLPSVGLKPADIRPWTPEGFIIGKSVHSPSEASHAGAEGADYLLLGPVFPTPSKTAYGPPLGLAAFRRACKRTSLPVFGLGGIDAGRIEAVCDAGAAGIAGIRLFQRDLADK